MAKSLRCEAVEGDGTAPAEEPKVDRRKRLQDPLSMPAAPSLPASASFYQALIEQTTDLVSVLSRDGTLLYVSPSHQGMLGYAPDALIGKNAFAFVHPADLAAIRARYSLATTSTGQTASGLYRFRHADGSWRMIEAVGTNLLDDPAVTGIVVNARDVTEREMWQQYAREELEARVRERTAELVGVNEMLRAEISERQRAEESLRQSEAARRQMEMEARQQLEGLAHVQRLTTAGAMTAEIAHQMNQPLTAITNFAGGLAARLRDGDVQPAVMREIIDRIATEAHRASEVIHRLRAFLRKGESVPRDCDLNQIVRHVYGLLADDFRRDAIEVTLDFDPRLPICCVDPILIEQVVLNLLRNASDALRGNDTPRSLSIETRVADASIEVAVRDSGIGLPPNAEKRIFEAFYTTKPDGLGLGLSVSRSIIDAAGGQLWVQRNAPRGTTVGFNIPLRMP